MLSNLYDYILPVIGEFFGKLTAIANMNASSFLYAIRTGNPLSIDYVNYFTGVTHDLTIFDISFFSTFVQQLLVIPADTTVKLLEIFGLSASMPLWLLLLLITGVIATILSFVKLLSKVFTQESMKTTGGFYLDKPPVVGTFYLFYAYLYL